MRILVPLRAIYRAVTSSAYEADERQVKPDERLFRQYRSEKFHASHDDWYTFRLRVCNIRHMQQKPTMISSLTISNYNQKGKQFYEKSDILSFFFREFPVCLRRAALFPLIAPSGVCLFMSKTTLCRNLDNMLKKSVPLLDGVMIFMAKIHYFFKRYIDNIFTVVII